MSISRSVSQCKETQTILHEADGASKNASYPSNVRVVPTEKASTSVSTMAINVTDVGGTSLEYGGGTKLKDTVVTASPQLGFKERAVSFSSVTEEDEEPLSLVSDRCRYISVSEEDETVKTTTVTSMKVQQYEQQSVITEQPTYASDRQIQWDLMLASKDISEMKTTPDNTTNNTTITVTMDDSNTPLNLQGNSSKTEEMEHDSKYSPTFALEKDKDTIDVGFEKEESDGVSMLPIEHQAKPTTTKYSSEDSDEYRSLETKDDGDFLISE